MNQPEEIELPARRFAGVATRVSHGEPFAISQLWDRFRADQTMARIPGRANHGAIVSVYSDYESDYTGAYTLLIGYEVSPDAVMPGGVNVVDVPPQKYAVILAQGKQPESVQSAWQWVWASALDRAYTVDFDEYLGEQDVRLHVALRS
jgi:predicted transcriptional regulator YdeE